MQILKDGFENPHLIEPALKRISARARKIGFSALQIKSFQKKLKSAFEAGVADPDSALLALERLFSENDNLKWVLQKDRLAVCLKLFGYCEQLGQQALKSPDKLLSALKQVERGKKSKEKIIQELQDSLPGSESFEELSKKVRSFRNDEYLRLALANLAMEDRLEDELKELSGLAETVMEFGLKELIRIMKPPALSRPRLSVLGMGKLGAVELNFSSDIDLIYLCPALLEESPAAADLLNAYARLAQSFTELIGKITEQGLVFRIDLRLRPGGENGPLVNPYDSAQDYYLSYGRSWERAAMLRARPVAGDLELGKKFLAELQPFVFRKFHDFASLEDLKQIKNRIDQEAAGESGRENFAGYNLKLGPGGIREIEFFVNSLQLIYGGKYPELRTSRTMDALFTLTRLGLVKDREAKILGRSWRLLRRLEHRIQLKDLRQDHRIPKTKRSQEILARSLGFCGPDGREKFLSELGKTLSEVQKIFSGLFGEEAKEPNGMAKFFYPETGPEELEPEFKKLGFAEPELAVEEWQRILRPLSQAGQEIKPALDILPVLLLELSQSPEPDLALRQLERFLTKTGARLGFLSLLKDHAPARKLLIALFSQSEFLANLLITHPELLDELVSPAALSDRSAAELERELARELAAATDYEEKLGRLRRFQQLELLRIGIKDLAMELEVRQLEERLTVLAELILRQAYEASLMEVAGRHGMPDAAKNLKPGLLVLGLGKLGGGEMGWASDLDLIFIYSGEGETAGKNPVDLREFFIKLSQKIIATLQTQTGEGWLYKIDTRLRPSGTQGPLVVDAAAFDDYHQDSAQVWEKQALLKARVLVDGAGIKDRVAERIAQSVYAGNDPERLGAEMKKLLLRVRTELARERENIYDIKFGYGGEMELDYILQYLQLTQGEREPGIRAGNNWEVMERLREFKLIEEHEYQHLLEALKIFRRVASRLRIYQDRPEHLVSLEPSSLERLAKKAALAEIETGAKLQTRIEAARERVHEIFLKYIGE